MGLSASNRNGALAPGVNAPAAETFTRPRTTPEPADTFTPEQQALDQRLREWRKAESEKLNLPSFFLLSSSTLRSIVLLHPQTIPQLLTISGIGQEKADRFGEAIISICRQQTGSTQAAMDDEARPATANREATRSTTQSRALLSADEVEQKRIADKERSLRKQQNLASYNEAQKILDAELRAWRKAHAAELEVPPFHLLADSLLHEIVLACPVSLTELNQVPGMGPTRIQKYGNAISAICTQVRLDQSPN